MTTSLDQEMASIARFILDNTQHPSPYFYSVPQSFLVPAVYFPPPGIKSAGDTLSTYAVDYSWYVVFFASTREEAYQMAMAALLSIRAARNHIFLIKDKESGELLNTGIRLKDPSVRPLDDGAAQLELHWTSRRAYDDILEHTADTTQQVSIQTWLKQVKHQSVSLTSDIISEVNSHLIEEREHRE